VINTCSKRAGTSPIPGQREEWEVGANRERGQNKRKGDTRALKASDSRLNRRSKARKLNTGDKKQNQSRREKASDKKSEEKDGC